MARTKIDWDELTDIVNKLHSLLQRKPRSAKRGFQLSPSGILNAYREGDLTFNQAVKHLEAWSKTQALPNGRLISKFPRR